MKEKKIYSLLGLATRSRNIVSGEFMTEKAIKSGTAHLVIVSEEASENTKKMFFNMRDFYQVPIFVFGKKEDLGHSMGKALRASVAVTDSGFAKSLTKLLNE